MLDIDELLFERDARTYEMIMQVHDELVFECPEDNADTDNGQDERHYGANCRIKYSFDCRSSNEDPIGMKLTKLL